MTENTTPERATTTARDILLAIVAVGAAAVAYRWVPDVYFFSDDFLHLYEIVNLPTHVFLLNPHGGHLNLVRNVVFSLTYAVAGYRPEWFMWTVLVAHLLNVWLLFRVIRLFTGSAVLACLGAVLWGSAPDAEGTLGWYSVYGQVLATTMLLLVLQSAGKYASETRVPSPATVATWVALSWVGALCFGSGLTFGVLLPVVLLLLVPGLWRERRTRLLLVAAPIVVGVLYVLLPALHAWLDPIRTEPSTASVLGGAWWIRISIWRQLATLAAFIERGLTGILETRGGPLAILQTPALVLLLAACAACLRRGTMTERRRLVAFLLLTGAAYGLVFVARGFSPNLTLVQRYHYYPQVPLLLTVAVLLERLVRGWTPRPALALGGLLVAVVCIVWLRGPHDPTSSRTHEPSRRYMDGFDAALTAMAERVPEGETLYLDNAPRQLSPMRIATTRFPGHAALFCVLHPDGRVAGRRVQIIEPDPSALAGADGGRCSDDVLISGVPPRTRVETIPPGSELLGPAQGTSRPLL